MSSTLLRMSTATLSCARECILGKQSYLNGMPNTSIGGGIPSVFARWATSKAGGSTKNSQHTAGKRLSVKKFEGKWI